MPSLSAETYFGPITPPSRWGGGELSKRYNFFMPLLPAKLRGMGLPLKNLVTVDVTMHREPSTGPGTANIRSLLFYGSPCRVQGRETSLQARSQRAGTQALQRGRAGQQIRVQICSRVPQRLSRAPRPPGLCPLESGYAGLETPLTTPISQLSK